MAKTTGTAELDALLATLQGAIGDSPVAADAIARELKRARRQTSAVSLREAAIVEKFRTELTDGLIRVDTVRQVLSLVQVIVGAILK